MNLLWQQHIINLMDSNTTSKVIKFSIQLHLWVNMSIMYPAWNAQATIAPSCLQLNLVQVEIGTDPDVKSSKDCQLGSIHQNQLGNAYYNSTNNNIYSRKKRKNIQIILPKKYRLLVIRGDTLKLLLCWQDISSKPILFLKCSK